MVCLTHMRRSILSSVTKVRRQAVPGSQGSWGAAVGGVGTDLGSDRHCGADHREAGLREQGVCFNWK